MAISADPDPHHGSMTITPWGRADELRARRLRPGPGSSREEVDRNQRERLLGATVAVVAERGYDATRVADLLELAGISRSAFYHHFANKQECFLAAVEEMIDRAGAKLAEAYDAGGDSWEDRARSVLDALAELIVAQPAAARVCVVEVYAAGPAATERFGRVGDSVLRTAADTLADSPAHAGMPRKLLRAIFGGMRQTVHTRLRHGREDELPGLVPELLEWALSYQPPARPLRRPRKPPPLPPAERDRDDQRSRMLAAITEAVAEKGYQAMTITEIAQRGAVSLSTFYAHFESKGDAFVAAIEDGEQRLFGATLPAFQASRDWPDAVRNALHAFFAFLATNPATAKLGGVDVYSGGPKALARHEQTLNRFQTLLEPGVERYGTGPIVPEAIGGAISTLAYDQLAAGNPERLYELAPTATFLALAPFVGNERAVELANERWVPPTSA